VHVRIADDERRYGVTCPVGCAFRYGDESNEERKRPELAQEAKYESLVDAFGKPGPEQKLKDEQNVCRDCKQVRLKRSKAERPDVEGKIVLRGSLRILSVRCICGRLRLRYLRWELSN